MNLQLDCESPSPRRSRPPARPRLLPDPRQIEPAIGLLAAAAVLIAAAVGQTKTLAAEPGPELSLDIRVRQTQVVVTWFAALGASYQLESSSNLTHWTNAGPLRVGTGATISVTNAVGASRFAFFRVEKIVGVITGTFVPSTGTLLIFGDANPNNIAVSRTASGVIRVNNGQVLINGGLPTVTNTLLIQAFGRAGDDRLALDETDGALPPAQFFGEAGNDKLIGGASTDTLDGGAGDDTLIGQGGDDTLQGGEDNDVVSGGPGNDTVLLGPGLDRFIWNPGDGTDVVEGGDGLDTVEVNGDESGEFFTVTANGTRVRFDRLEPAPFFLDLGTCEELIVNARGGNDRFAATGNLAALIQITVDGGPGEDTLLGSNGPDTLIGGAGNDLIDGNQGSDALLLGTGDDQVQWDPGDGSDVIEGQAGHDTLVFHGSAGSETFELSALGSRLRVFRNLGSVVLDGAGLEAVDLRALGGTDIISISDLAATSVTQVDVSLFGTFASSGGDSLVDRVILFGSERPDVVTVIGSPDGVVVQGLSPTVTIRGAEPTLDLLGIYTFGGSDSLDASALPGDLIGLFAAGGAEDDVLIGSGGADVLFGDDGDDILLGGPGLDALDGGAGNNVVIQ